MRIINEKLTNEISSQPNDMEVVLNSDAEVIALEFGEIFKTLEMKKQQLMEDVENQRSKKEKEFQIWKKMKETHKKTIENFLKDCEKLVHECDPQRFLEVACGLNTRMKTQLDLMNIASSYEKPPVYIQKKIDIKPVVNEILALKLTSVHEGIDKDLPSGGNESSTKIAFFTNNINQWQDQKNIPHAFLPVAGQEEAVTDGSGICTRLMSISEMSAFQNMSHEELRYKYYMERQKLTSEFKLQTSRANKKYKFVTAEALKDRSSGTPLVSSSSEASNTDTVKMGTLQRIDGFEASFSGTSNHSSPSTNTNFFETNSDLKSFHERCSQEVTPLALPENSKDLVIKEKMPVQASAVIVSNKMARNSSASSGLKAAASVAVTVSNSEILDVSGETLSASPFAFSACNNSLPRFIKDAGAFSFKKKDRKYVFPQFYLGKCDHTDKNNNQDETNFRNHGPVTKPAVSDASTSPNLESAESENTNIPFLFGNAERDCFPGLGVSNSFKVLPFSSFFSQSKKPSDKGTSSHMSDKTPTTETADHCTQKSSVSWKQKDGVSESITTVACSISETTTASGVNDASESSHVASNCVFSFNSNCFQFAPPVFSFGNTVSNTSDSLTSSVFLPGNATGKMEKEKATSPNKTLLNLGKFTSSECSELASRHSHPKCEGSSLHVNSCKKMESSEMPADTNSSCTQPLCSVIFPVKCENASSAPLNTATKQEIKDEEGETVSESTSCPRREEPESVQHENADCSVSGMCNDLCSGDSVLKVNEAGGMPSDSDSDTEELSQTSASTDASTSSEYFSVAEDKVSSRRKSET